MIYIIIAIWFLITAYIFDVKGTLQYRNSVFWIQFACLFLLGGLRYKVGTDSYVYEDFFYLVPNIFDLKLNDVGIYNFEPLWVIYNSLLKAIWNNFIIVQLVNAFILNYAIFKIAKLYSVYPFHVVFFYFLFDYLILNFEFMRQSLAVGLFVGWGIPYLLNKKWVRYYVLVLVCLNIHFASVVMIVLPLIKKFRLDSKHIFIYSFVFLILAVSINSYFFDIITHIVRDKYILYKINKYANWSTNYNILFYISRLYLPLVIGYLIIFLINRNDSARKYFLFVFLVMIFSVSATIFDGFGRLNYYINVFFFMALAEATFALLRFIKSKDHFLALILFIIFLSPPVIMVMGNKYEQFNSRFYNKFIPYYTVFRPKEASFRKAMKENSDHREHFTKKEQNNEK